MTDPRDTLRWLWRGIALAVLLFGWVFFAWKYHFHVTAPLVFLCLGYLAAVVTVYNLFWTGAAAVDSSQDEGDSTWAKPIGALSELEREKRTLLKAIKEAEFDHQMGKLSQRDADEMIRGYRARAIDVIKEIDLLGHGAAGTVRDQILREVRARVQLETKSPRKVAAAAQWTGGAQVTAELRWHCPTCATTQDKGLLGVSVIPGASAAALGGLESCSKCGARFAQSAVYGGAFDVGRTGDGSVKEPADAQVAAGPRTKQAAKAAARAARAKPGVPAAGAARPEDAPAAAESDAAAAGARTDAAPPAEARSRSAAQQPTDDELDADSTTAMESRHDDPAKEATP